MNKAASKTSPRDRILRAASSLIAENGASALTTRAVSAAAKVQPPTIYRLFQDMDGLFDTVAKDVLADYIRSKEGRERSADPVEDLRAGWDIHVSFGLSNPAVFVRLYGRSDRAFRPDANANGLDKLSELFGRVAAAGRLRVSVDQATLAYHAAGTGVTLTLLSAGEIGQQLQLSEIVREALIRDFVVLAPGSRSGEGTGSDTHPQRNALAARAIDLRSAVERFPTVLTDSEHRLLIDWLDRIVRSSKPERSTSQTPKT